MIKKIFFRFEASPLLGAGHAIRCSALMAVFKKMRWDVYLITSQDTLSFLPFLRAWPYITPNETICRGGVIVIDHYGIRQEEESRLRCYFNKIVVIDDLANAKHDADLLVNSGIHDSSVYQDLVPNSCQILVGFPYVLLREKFAYMRAFFLRKRSLWTGSVARVLVSMGGGNTEDATMRALDLLSDVMFGGCVDIISGFYPFDLATQYRFCRDRQFRCFFYYNIDPIILFKKADIVIGAAGSSVFERAVLGIPQFVIPLYNNQKLLADYFESDNFPLFWRNLSSCPGVPHITRKIDGLGARRVAFMIESLL